MGKAWRDERWDSFTLVTPNWQLRLPDMEYEGQNPEGFLTRQEVIDYLKRFAEQFDPPIKEGVKATSVESAPNSDQFIVNTDNGTYSASNVVVATGTFQKPDIPEFSDKLSDDLMQIHSSEYENPDQLPPGGVLVVGSGQSGCQIAEELFNSGRQVYLSTGRANRLPRRYRGKDFTRWLKLTGFIDRTVDELESPSERFDPNPHVSGKDGGHTINLHQFYKRGIQLLGHAVDGEGKQLEFAPDLEENLTAADRAAREFKEGIDELIQKKGIEAPEAEDNELDDGYDAPTITSLDLDSVNLRSIIWATGYSHDFSWVDFPIFDQHGYPIQDRGVTDQPGLYFLGLHWLHTIKSGLFLGVGEDAAHVAEHIEARE